MALFAGRGTARAEEVTADNIPDGFVLNGMIKVFNIIDAQVYVFSGHGAHGQWQIVPLHLSVALSTFVPELMGQPFDSVQLSNVQMAYHEYSTLTEASGDVLNVVDLGMSFMLKSEREAYAPYNRIWKYTIGFFGKVHIDMPNNIAAVTMDFSIVEDKGVLIFSASAGDDPNIANGFAGVAGLRLAELSLTTAFLMSKSPSMLLFQASASLALRDSVLELVGFYAKSDWALSCEMHDFDFANLRDMYEDLFGGPLHLTQHEVVFKELALIATPSGLTISGHVTVEGHASAAAVIAMKRTGLYISGQVGDVMLSDGIVLKEAAIDIFIGQ
ncbi:hypothetical protein Brms1b_010271 [Colletotrichum noveboracense]|nr:hypothetical protein Brms1b_010271 [Colletotrichum noveboracense]